jgi:hypothetical protein
MRRSPALKRRLVLDLPAWTIPSRKAFATIRVEAWSQFSDLIETHFLDWSEYAYRGQRCSDWQLLSKFDRERAQSRKLLEQTDPYAGLDCNDRALVEQAIEGKNGRTLPERTALLEEHLSAFKTAALGRRGASLHASSHLKIRVRLPPVPVPYGLSVISDTWKSSSINRRTLKSDRRT